MWGAFRNTETSRVLDGPQLGLADDERSWVMKYDRLIVAAGSRDLGISFAGWNMAGTMGANGAHSLMSRYRALTSQRMVVMGSGNLGLNTARMAQDRGVEVAAVVEVSSSARGDKALMTGLRDEGVKLYTSHTVKEASGKADDIECVVLVEIDDNDEPVAGSEKVIAADTVCLAIGLVPNVELLSLLDCDLAFKSELGGYVPEHDDWMRTSVDTVFVAGDAAGFHDGMILDPEIARNQGRLAGAAAAESLGVIDSVKALGRRSDIQASAVAATPTEVHTGWRRWLQSLVNAGGLDIFACQCEEVTRAEAHRLAASAVPGMGIAADEPSEPPDPGERRPGQPRPGEAPDKGRNGPLPGPTLPRAGVSAACRGVWYRHRRSTLDVLPATCAAASTESHVAPRRDAGGAEGLAQVVQSNESGAGVEGRQGPRHRSGFMPVDSADVVVIGGGVSGLSSAYFLARAGQRCRGSREGDRWGRGLRAKRRDDQRAG